MLSRWLVPAAFAAVLLASRLPARDAGAKAPSAVDFNRHVRPILADRCFACHGPDEKHRKAKLRLDTRDGLMELVKPGDAAGSDLIDRVCSDDASLLMPPPKSGPALTAEQVATLKTWITQGAEWKEHWSFVPPKRPAGEHSVDGFLKSRLTAEQLAFNPPAERPALARRVFLDLTGLPPTPEDLDRFLADARPDAYERLVESLFQSPRHGEHMARYWLDAVRYSDTHGLHFDAYREVWPYRDWVVKAFAENLPFDRFLTEQLAGDLLPNATRDQRVASGFNRMHVTTNEGGSIAEEVYVRNVTDRVDGVGTVVLGLTAGCAKCHDHKYDPLKTREYYGLFAFFNSLDDNPLDGNSPKHAPIIALDSPEQAAKQKEIDTKLAAVNKRIAAARKSVVLDDAPESKAERRDYVWVDDAVPAGATRSADAMAWAFVGGPDHPVHAGQKSHVRTATGRGQHFFTAAAQPLRVGKGDVLFAYVYLDPANPPKEVMMQWHLEGWKHRAYWGENLVPFGKDDSDERRRLGDLPALGEWVRLEVPVAAIGIAPGARIDGWAFTQHGGTVHWDAAGLVTQTPQATEEAGSFATWLRAAKPSADKELPKPLAAAIKLEPGKRSAAQTQQLKDYFIERVHGPSRPLFAPLLAERAAVEQEREALTEAIPTTFVSQEKAEPRPAYILKRGEYDQHGDQVGRITPSFLPPFPTDAPRNRLGFAKWVTDPKHPLTARVAVNRFWQQFFGTGLVKTADDFGLQGEPPTHQELLDWLAVEFADGWDVRALVRRVVLSRAYRESAAVTPEKFQRDPANRLLSRGPRYRLDAEVVRDQALYVSGLLQEQPGGKAVKPPQPAGLWEAVGYPRSNTAKFVADTGAEKVHRRSLYTFWKRTAPPPQMVILDAPSRESCVVRRERTNTPLQALLLMNETQFVEAARALAERGLSETHADDAARLAALFRRVTGRVPGEREATVLGKALATHRATFAADANAARQLIAVGETTPSGTHQPAEVAAWTMVANVLLNLDEVVTK